MIDRMDHLMRRAIDSELNQWGAWHERHSDYEGYPGCDNIQAFLNGAGGGTPGHRVLCLDMPIHIYAVHGRVLRLIEEQRLAVYVWYVIRLKEDGTRWGLAEKAEKSGFDPVKLRSLVNDAVRVIAGVEIGEEHQKMSTLRQTALLV